ncbi:choline-sulfatase [Alphaproteobacteria bacterium KMM 3653]|uniref:Choline-sulfatase n=1 Tax=Harenicola maris TaxID=2841044 RepID=A0AAP2G3X9_9RHOB|nr:choline-sulfatase [Harenicola maris]
MAQNTPNILVIMADQLAPQFMGTYGHGVVQTPNIDALAARGARFDAAYCNSPLCAPSRASFMAGQHVSAIETYDNAAEFPASIPTFAHHLRAQGYRTCLSGKMHFVGPDQLHGFEERLTTDIYPADHAWTPDWEDPLTRIHKWYHNMESVAEAGHAATTFQIEYDEETAFLARRRIFEYAMQGVAPFCMVASFIHPHDPYVARPEFWELYDGVEIDLPEVGEVAEDPHSKRLRSGYMADQVEVSDAALRHARRAYFANVSYFDHNVGVLVRALEESGQLENTLVVVTSDHGDMLGERGLWYKMSYFEHSVRVPLVMAGPGVKAGHRAAAPCSLIDLLPSFVELAGDEVEAPGRSLLAEAGGADGGEGEAIAEYFAECAAWPMYMIRRGRFKYIACKIDPPQLYDLEADPLERCNLAAVPEYAEVAQQFAEEAARRWDCEALHAGVIASQKRRRLVHAAMEQGALTSWDYAPQRDFANEFVRNHQDWNDAVEKLRYPPAE